MALIGQIGSLSLAVVDFGADEITLQPVMQPSMTSQRKVKLMSEVNSTEMSTRIADEGADFLQGLEALLEDTKSEFENEDDVLALRAAAW